MSYKRCNNGKFKCDVCNKSFTYEKCIVNHIQKHHSSNVNKETYESQDAQNVASSSKANPKQVLAHDDKSTIRKSIKSAKISHNFDKGKEKPRLH